MSPHVFFRFVVVASLSAPLSAVMAACPTAAHTICGPLGVSTGPTTGSSNAWGCSLGGTSATYGGSLHAWTDTSGTTTAICVVGQDGSGLSFADALTVSPGGGAVSLLITGTNLNDQVVLEALPTGTVTAGSCGATDGTEKVGGVTQAIAQLEAPTGLGMTVSVNALQGDDIVVGSNTTPSFAETLWGEDGDDCIHGRDGDDTIAIATRSVVLDGGTGGDIISLAGTWPVDVTVDAGSGDNQVQLYADFQGDLRVESGAGRDDVSLVGDVVGLLEVIQGDGANAFSCGSAGTASVAELLGGGDDDTWTLDCDVDGDLALDPRHGLNVVDVSGDVTGTLDYAGGDDRDELRVYASSWGGALVGTAGGDDLVYFDGGGSLLTTLIHAGDGDDEVRGSGGSDAIFGGGGDDVLCGMRGIDVITDYAGNNDGYSGYPMAAETLLLVGTGTSSCHAPSAFVVDRPTASAKHPFLLVRNCTTIAANTCPIVP